MNDAPFDEGDFTDPAYIAAIEQEAALGPKVEIQIQAGELPAMATLGESALLSSSFPVFQRGNSLVRPVKQYVAASRGRPTIAAGLQQIVKHSMIDMLAQAAEWQVWNIRKKAYIPANPPESVANIILSRSGQWRVPIVAGVTTTPTLRPDGSVLINHGYDEQTRLFHVKDPNLKLTPVELTRNNALAALNLLLDLLNEFPFVSPIDRAVALSGIITPVVRGALNVVPMHAFRATTAGTGKSYLADIASAIATGRPCPVIAVGHTEEETEKRLTGLLLAGFPVISIDNVNGELGGDLLCQAIERQLLRVRPLGKSEITEIESRATMFATGNSLRVRGDMTRRTLICDLDANMERPETRTFSANPLEKVLANRGAYVTACLTIIRAYMNTGLPSKLQPIASFSDWSDLVRSSLVWLGQADPAISMETAREDDPELTQLRETLGLWDKYIGPDTRMPVRSVIQIAERKLPDDYGHQTSDLAAPDFLESIMRIAGERGAVNQIRFANWLRKNEGRIVSGLKFKRDGMMDGKVVGWVLRKG